MTMTISEWIALAQLLVNIIYVVFQIVYTLSEVKTDSGGKKQEG